MSDGIIIAIIGLIGVAGTPVLMHILQRRRNEKMRTGVMRGLEATRAIYGLLHEIVHSTSAERVVLFAGHNSGGVPRPHSPFYVTALHWVCKNQHQASLIRDYQGLIVDANYIGMLLDVERHGKVTLIPEHMPECQLKQIYASEGISQSIIFYIAITENKFLYLSVAKYSGQFDVNEVTRINLKVMKMRPHCITR